MKSLWTIVTIMSVANMLAVAGFLGWLGATDRVSAERFREIKAIVAPTITEAQAAREAADALASEEARAADDAARRANPPLSPAAVLTRRVVDGDADSQRIERVRQQADELLAQVEAERDALFQSRADFDAERAAWQAERDRLATAAADAQFQKEVELFSALKPRDAKALVLEMETRGEREDLVRLLDALQTRVRAKIFAELKAPDERRLASELLTRLRELGRPTPGTEAPVEPIADVDPLEPADG